MIPQSILTFFLGRRGHSHIGADIIVRLSSSVAPQIFLLFAIIVSQIQNANRHNEDGFKSVFKLI